MIKINLIRETRAGVSRDVGGAPRGAASMRTSAAPPRDINNVLLVGLLVAGLLASGGWWFLKSRELSNKQEEAVQRRAEAQQLESIIAEVEQFQKRKDSLERRIQLINDLKQRQKGPVRIMDKISQLLPDLVWLTSMNFSTNTVTMQGKALNPTAIANYVENIKNDPTFEEPVVDAVTTGQEGTTTVYSWGMTFNFTYAAEDALSEPAAAAPAAAGQPAAAPVPGAGT